MASYRGHLMLAAPLGAAYGLVPLLRPEPEWGPAFLGAGLCTLGGLMPDLDSDSGVPVRELFGVLAAVVPALMYEALVREHHLPLEQALVVLAGVYLLIRYVLSGAFKRWTVHRGMFHSVPALLASCRTCCSTNCAASISWAFASASTSSPAAPSSSSRRRGRPRSPPT
jgi:hypothetical protein